MGIEIPGYLQWVSYLVGSEWPQGDEDGMWRIGEHWHNSSTGLTALIPDLNEVRAETMAVLAGQTAAAADEQFKMLFDGDYSVDKLASAMSALGELADKTGTAIEYTKISILFSLGKAAIEIMYAYATASETWGASLAEIPIVEAFTRYSVRQAIMNLLKQIFGQLDKALQKTVVKVLLREGLEKTEWAVVKELTVQGIQMANGHRNGLDWSKFAKNVGVGFIGGAVNQLTKDALKDLLKLTTQRVVTDTGELGFREVDDRIEGAIKGAVTGYAGGTVASAAGTLATGGQLDPKTLFTSGIASAIKGGTQGAAKANSVQRYDAGYYPAGKVASTPFKWNLGSKDPLPTTGLAVTGLGAGGAAWVGAHPSTGHSGTSSSSAAVPQPTAVPIPLQGLVGGDSGTTAGTTMPTTSPAGNGGGPSNITAPYVSSGPPPAGPPPAGPPTSSTPDDPQGPPPRQATPTVETTPIVEMGQHPTGSTPGPSESVGPQNGTPTTAAAASTPIAQSMPAHTATTAQPMASPTTASPNTAQPSAAQPIWSPDAAQPAAGTSAWSHSSASPGTVAGPPAAASLNGATAPPNGTTAPPAGTPNAAPRSSPTGPLPPSSGVSPAGPRAGQVAEPVAPESNSTQPQTNPALGLASLARPTDGRSDGGEGSAPQTDSRPGRRERPQYHELHWLEVNADATAVATGKGGEYQRQITRQIDALNQLTAIEVLHNMDGVQRDGAAQEEALLIYHAGWLTEGLAEARRLLRSDPDALGALTTGQYAIRSAVEQLSQLNTFDGPDGPPAMRDTYVNVWLGSPLPHRVADDLRSYAQGMVAAGYGDFRVNVRWRRH